jgi:cytochrome P450
MEPDSSRAPETNSVPAADFNSDLRLKYDPSDPAVRDDPFPYYRALVAAPPLLGERRGVPWAVVSRYRDAVEVLRDHRRFSSVNPQLPGTEDFDVFNGIPAMAFSDPPLHSRLRRVVAPALAVRRMNELEPQFREICDAMLRAWDGSREVDVKLHLATKFPVRVLGYLLDIPQSDYGVIRSLAAGTESGDFVSEQFAGSRDAYIRELIERRRRQGGGEDLISMTLAAHEAGDRIDSLELFGTVSMLVVAGIGTTADLISGCIYQLTSRPELLGRVRQAPALVPAALEETLRYDGPVHCVLRVTTEDVDVGGTLIKARTPVYVVLGAANRDPAAFDEPDRFDIMRAPNDHLGLGEGIHFCVGAAPARVQAKVAVQMLLERFPHLRLPDGWMPRYTGGAFGRGVAELPIRLD